jgi:hypothetical protein
VRSKSLLIATIATGLSCSKPSAEPDAGGPLSLGRQTATDSSPSAEDRAGPVGADASQADWPSATVSVLDEGRKPRRRLRYVWRIDQHEELTMNLQTVASTENPDADATGVALPPVRIVLAIDPSGVSPEGDMHFAWRVASSHVKADPGIASQLADGMRTEVAAIEHLAGTAVVTSRGLVQSIVIDPKSASLGESSGQMVEQVRQTLRGVAVPFPEEEVGLGARWQKLSELSSKDALITQSDTFALRSLAATRGSVDDVLAQTAPPQPLKTPGAPEEGQARMESMLASGTARMTFDLERLVAQAKIESTTTMVVSRPSRGDGSRRMTMILRVEISLTGSAH